MTPDVTGHRSTCSTQQQWNTSRTSTNLEMVTSLFYERTDIYFNNTQPVVEPALPRITVPFVTSISAAPCTTNGSVCDLHGRQSQDDDEDSLPIVHELDLADHVPCSTRDMTTSGHENPTLTQLGFEMATPAVGTDSKGLVTTGSSRNPPQQNANLTLPFHREILAQYYLSQQDSVKRHRN